MVLMMRVIQHKILLFRPLVKKSFETLSWTFVTYSHSLTHTLSICIIITGMMTTTMIAKETPDWEWVEIKMNFSAEFFSIIFAKMSSWYYSQSHLSLSYFLSYFPIYNPWWWPWCYWCDDDLWWSATLYWGHFL